MENRSNNTRITKNTIFLNIRMLFVMGVTLYTSRVILKVLGVEDYGIYNVIGGMVGMLAFFTSSLSNATQRFLSIELGREDEKGARRVFNQSLLLYAAIGLVFLVISESVGLWYLWNKMVVPPSRMEAATWIFHISVFTLFLGIIQVPYLAAIVARERMKFYAYLGIFDVIARLLMIFMLQWIKGYDKLVLYGLMMGGVQLLTILFYIRYCVKHFPECSFMFFWDRRLVREIGSFIGYNLFGCFAWSAGVSGSNLVLNLFFGPAVNAARGIAMQVNAAVVRFTDSIMTAIKPQIIKSYAQGEINYMTQLICYSSKYAFWLMLLLSLPVFFNTSYILALWLTEVPDYSVIFIRLLLVEQVISVLIPPLWIAANATGKIKNQQFYGRMFTLMALPVSYMLLRFGVFTSPTVVFWTLIIAQTGYWGYCFYDIHRQLGLTPAYYFQSVIIPGLKVLLVTVLLLILCGYFLPYGFHRLLLLTLLSMFSIGTVAYLWGIEEIERQYVRKLILKYIHV